MKTAPVIAHHRSQARTLRPAIGIIGMQSIFGGTTEIQKEIIGRSLGL